MIVIVDRDQGRIQTIKKWFGSNYHCTVAESAQQLHNLRVTNKVRAVIADTNTLAELDQGFPALLLFNKIETKLVLLSDSYSSTDVRTFSARGIIVFPTDVTPAQLETVILPENHRMSSRRVIDIQKKNMSQLRDHLFSNLLEGHDLPADTDQLMDFLGLSSPTYKYYLAFVISYQPITGQAGTTEWETALKIQDIACEEISKLAINRSCLRTPNRIAFVLLMQEPGDPFRFDLEKVLQIIEKRIAKECGHQITVGVGLADNTIHGLICGYQQACSALDQGVFFGKSFVSFYCDLWERSPQRFQFSKAVKEQITQLLCSRDLEQIDLLIDEQLHQFVSMGFATQDNILALKIDLIVFLMDLSDKLSIMAEKPEFNTRLINSCLKAESLPDLEMNIKQHLREIVSTSRAAQERRASRIVRNAQHILQERISEPINVQLLAQCIHISPNYLSTLFRSETGVRLTEYITIIKMQEAARLLRDTECNIIEIANAVGYSNPNYFSRLFKKCYGLVPSDYRIAHNHE